MTTAATRTPRTGRVLAGAAAWLVGAVAVLAAVAVLTQEDPTTGPAVRGVLVGGGLVLAVSVFGTTTLGAAAKVLPQAALLVALLTYTLQLLVLALVLVAFHDSAQAQQHLSKGWLAGGMITATLAWMAGQVLVSLRTPIEPWDPTTAGAR